MDFEYKAFSFPANEQLSAEVQRLSAEGWGLVSGAQPIAVYYLMRPKQAAAYEQLVGSVADVKMNVDDSKVHVMRNGKIVQ